MQNTHAKTALSNALLSLIARSAGEKGSGSDLVNFDAEPLWFANTEASIDFYKALDVGVYSGWVKGTNAIPADRWEYIGGDGYSTTGNESTNPSTFFCVIKVMNEATEDSQGRSDAKRRDITITKDKQSFMTTTKWFDDADWDYNEWFFTIKVWDYAEKAKLSTSSIALGERGVKWYTLNEVTVAIEKIPEDAQTFGTTSSQHIILNGGGHTLLTEERALYKIPMSISKTVDWMGAGVTCRMTLPKAILIRTISLDDTVDGIVERWERIEDTTDLVIDEIANAFDRLSLPEGEIAGGYENFRAEMTLRKLWVGDDDIFMKMQINTNGTFTFSHDEYTIVTSNGLSRTTYTWLPAGVTDATDYEVRGSILADTQSFATTTLTTSWVDVTAGLNELVVAGTPSGSVEATYQIDVRHKPTGKISTMNVTLAAILETARVE